MWSAELVHLVKRFGRHVAIDNVTLGIDAGDIVGVVGPNGAGKTTLLRLLAGILRPTRGHVRFRAPRTADSVRYFAGERTLPPSVSTRRWLKLWRLEAESLHMPRSLSRHDGTVTRKRMTVLSRGTRQHLGLMTALRPGTPTLVVLDEPWEGLDPDASRWLASDLSGKRSSGAAVVVSSHRIHDLASVCTKCVFLINGALSSEVVTLEQLRRGSSPSAVLFDAFDRAQGR